MMQNWLLIGLVVAVATLVPMDSVTAEEEGDEAEEEEEGEQRAAAISNLSFRQVHVLLWSGYFPYDFSMFYLTYTFVGCLFLSRYDFVVTLKKNKQ